MREIRDKVLKEIKPDEKEHKRRINVVKDFISLLEENSNVKVEYFVGGSFGKNTYLTTSSDVDIFARFDKKYNDEELSNMLIYILNKTGVKYKKQKGSRDYYSTEIKGIKFEIVPNRKINDASEMVNSTDVSPLHVEFLKEKCLDNKKLCDEIRLAKQFFKSKGLYGAESYINCLSGHVIDILIAYYGSLESFLKGVKDWGEDMFIDINGFYKGKKDGLVGIEKDKQSKLVLVDPILKTRNAARALSDENYAKLLVLAENFDKFSLNDFKIEKFDLMKTIKNSKKFGKVNGLRSVFFVFDFKVEDNSEDIIGSKLLKLYRRLHCKFVDMGFEIFLDKFYIDMKKEKCLFVYFFESNTIPRLKKIIGPYVHMKKAVKAFIKARDFYFVEENRLYSYEQRAIYTLDKLIKIDVKEMEEIVGRDISFVKKVRVFKK